MSNGRKEAPSAGQAVIQAPNGGNGPARRIQARLEGLDIELTPDRLAVEVTPLRPAIAAERLNAMWHPVKKPKGIRVAISSSDSRHRLLRLSAECEDSDWQGRWAKWTFVARKSTELQGGDTVDAQDILDRNGAKLQIMVAPGETREATLEFRPMLDGESFAGDYLFDVVAEDLTDGENADEVPATSRSGILNLRHSGSKLLRQLPSIYYEALYPNGKADSGYREAEFFERFLLGFEDFVDRLIATLESLDKLFGPDSTPPDFLLWLAAWVCMPLDENWPEMRQRQLIREAVELWRWRGTRRGLARFLQIYTGVLPEINDTPFKGMRLGPQAKLGTDETILGDVPDHTFVVTLTLPDNSAANEQTVRRIIRFEKPAHTAYALNIVSRASTPEA